jgi:uncharacterized RDD family membrane protein YckC
VVADEFGALVTVTYAGFRKRMGAWIIDSIIVTILQLIILGGLLSGSGVVTSNVVGFMIGLLYFAGTESSSKQATLGKMTLGIVVTDTEGNRITFMRATGRYLAKITSALTLLMGYIMVAFTHRKQGLHDIIAQTLVVNGRR